VSWAQSRNSLLLTVDVKDARETGDLFLSTDTAISFRFIHRLLRHEAAYRNNTIYEIKV